MPLPLKQFSPSDAQTTQNGWKIPIPFNSQNARAILHNQSNTEFGIYTDYGDYIATIPAGVLFIPVDIGYSTSYLEFRAGNVVTSNVVPTNYVNGDIYKASEKKPDVQPVAMSRSVSIGNPVTTATTNAIIANGQTDGLTVTDISESPATNPAFFDALRPTNNAFGQRGIEIDSLQTGVGYVPEIQIYNGVNILHGPLKLLNAGIAQVFNEVTAGAMGVAATPFTLLNGIVNAIAAQTFTFITVNNGFYRANMHFILANGTSGNNITARVSYTNNAGVAVTHFFQVNQNGIGNYVVANTATSLPNGTYICVSIPFYALGGGGKNIIFTFQDPTNTPNDTVSCVLERLA